MATALSQPTPGETGNEADLKGNHPNDDGDIKHGG